MFPAGVALVLAVVAVGAFAPEALQRYTSDALDWVTVQFGWLLTSAVNLFVVLCVVLALSRYGRIRLGGDDERPEFATLPWVAMMFASGMGIGLMFYGAAEPLSHLADPPPGSGAEAGSVQAAEDALRQAVFHWTLHPWAVFGMTGLALAYATFRKGRRNRISAVFTPLLGRGGAEGSAAKLIDLLTVFATVFGSATSLGLGALQITSGLGSLTGIPSSLGVQTVVVGALTVAFVASAFTGVHRGVKTMSTVNIVLAGALLAFVLVLGPTTYLLDSLPAAVGAYLDRLSSLATATGAYSDVQWLGNWTLFFWAWALSWAPFVGTFIAKVSRGRTIREFIVGVLLVPSAGCAVWFTVVGGTALHTQRSGAADLTASLDEGLEAALFHLLETMPLHQITTGIAIVLVAVYFITGGDSASVVLGTLTGRLRERPNRWTVAIWGVLIGAVAAVLLAAGGLTALQNAVVLVALPYTLVLLAMCWALFKELRTDRGSTRVSEDREPARREHP
ncbi:BCCT family transporter [Glycomyces sp. NEAU-7082]|uniref:BCCT family transporter n=1 Tax=Glycomyces albidus TaxID=2656774 RepID=A0A6L5GB33_9ACTN|nr:BCCT family transporter [Glycomyces albidus]